MNPGDFISVAKASIIAVVNSAIALAGVFGFGLSAEQTGAVLAFVNAVLALGFIILTLVENGQKKETPPS